MMGKQTGSKAKDSVGEPENRTRKPYKNNKTISETEDEDSSDESEEEELPRNKHKKAKPYVEISRGPPKGKATSKPEKKVTFEEPRKGNLPFKQVPDANFVPVRAAIDKGQRETIPGFEKGPGYRHIAPIDKYDGVDAKIALRTPITLTLGDLLKAAPLLRNGIKDLLTKRREPQDIKAAALLESMTEDQVGYWANFLVGNQAEGLVEASDLPAATYTVNTVGEVGLPAGAVVVSDPVLQYLESLQPGENPLPIYVAHESQSLRVVHPVVNGLDTEECILDGGSQIVSMAKASAIRLNVSWDPGVQIHMQSANKQIEKSLGLAKNVPFKFGEITVYLQVHIIESPAYKVLLGRPFDAVTRSVYQNDETGGQLLTLRCPNTRKSVVMPTSERGKSRTRSKQSEEDFQ
jgi:hypothetical protein